MRAEYQTKKAKLDSDFGREMAARYFTPEQLATVEGSAWLVWEKCTKGGWRHQGCYMGESAIGYVMRPGTHDVRIEKNGAVILESSGRLDQRAA